MANSDDKPQVIIFNHVPKAGGTSLIHFFSEIFGPERVFRHEARDGKTDKISPSIESLSKEQLDSYSFFAGHFGYGYHKLFDRSVKYIGIIRDPMDRAVSHYRYLRKNGPRALKEQALEMTFEEYLEFRLSVQKNPMVESSQIELLTGQIDFDAAKEVVKRDYLACCTTAQLNDMQTTLAAYYGRPDLGPKKVNRTNGSKTEPEISEDLKAELDRRFALDRKFMNWVEQTYEDTFSRIGEPAP